VPHLPMVLYGVLAALSLGSATGVVLCRSVVHSAACLVLATLGVGGILGFLLGAPLVAAALALVYGTLAVLVYLLAVREGEDAARSVGVGAKAALPSAAACLALAALLAVHLLDVGDLEPLLPGDSEGLSEIGDSATTALGRSLVDRYLMSFGLLGVFLLIGTLAVVQAARAVRPPEEGER